MSRRGWSIVLGLGVCGACSPDTSGLGAGGTMATESSSSTSTGASIGTHDATDPTLTADDGTTLASSSTTDVSADATTADLTTTGSTGPTTDTADTEEPPQQIEYCAVANLPIPDHDVGGVTSSIEVDLLGGGTIVSLQLVIEATHSYVGDLRFDLRKTEASVIALDQPGDGMCSGNDIDVVLHDGGVAPAATSCINDDVGPALSGELQPFTAFDPVFAGTQMLGTWRLLAIDRAEDDTGTLDAWCLRITYR